jgi:phage-related holin
VELYKFWDRLTEAWQITIACCVIFNWLFGEYRAGLGALFCLVVMDWLTKWGVLSKKAGGFWIAWKTDVISSRGMREGLKKIFWYMAVLIAAHQLEQFSILGFTIGQASTEIMSAYLAIIEAKSILENLRDMGMKDVEPLLAMLGRKQNQITEGKKE